MLKNLIKPKYHIIRVNPKHKPEYYVAERRYFWIFWMALTESVPIGFADFQEFEVHHKTEAQARDQIRGDYFGSWYYRLQEPCDKIEIDIESYLL